MRPASELALESVWASASASALALALALESG
jgi:hypothetical protein